jgi:hypothetical protein
MKDVDNVQVDVDDMLERWRQVEANGRSLKESSEMLLGERVSEIIFFICAQIDMPIRTGWSSSRRP